MSTCRLGHAEGNNEEGSGELVQSVSSVGEQMKQEQNESTFH